MGRRYTYTDEFKAEAVASARSSVQPRYRIAESLGVSDGALASWIKDAERDEQPGALSSDERAELNRLRKRLAEVSRRRRSCAERPRISRERRPGDPLLVR